MLIIFILRWKRDTIYEAFETNSFRLYLSKLFVFSLMLFFVLVLPKTTFMHYKTLFWFHFLYFFMFKIPLKILNAPLQNEILSHPFTFLFSTAKLQLFLIIIYYYVFITHKTLLFLFMYILCFKVRPKILNVPLQNQILFHTFIFLIFYRLHALFFFFTIFSSFFNPKFSNDFFLSEIISIF